MSTASRPRPDVASDETEQLSQLSVGDLVGEVGRDMSQLVRQEMHLAKAELRQDAKRTGQAAGAFGGAGMAGYMVLLFASIALWWGLANVMNPGWAALVVASYSARAASADCSACAAVRDASACAALVSASTFACCAWASRRACAERWVAFACADSVSDV